MRRNGYFLQDYNTLFVLKDSTAWFKYHPTFLNQDISFRNNVLKFDTYMY